MRIFMLITFLFFIALPAKAEDIKLCEALFQDKAYEGNSSYLKMDAGKKGWVFRTSTDYKDDFKVNSILQDRFIRLHNALEKNNIELVIVPLPTRGMMHSEFVLDDIYNVDKAKESYGELVHKLRQMGYIVADINDFSAAQEFYYKYDHHWNASGAQKMAQRVAAEMKIMPAFKAIKKAKFITEKEEQIEYEGSFAEFIAEQCKTKPSKEKATIYKTYQESGGEDDLFSDDTKPEIILLGTSNSSLTPSYANFEGFLKEYLSADVQNMSISGGGVETAILDYFNAGKQVTDKPKILIWEIPVYQNFRGGTLYRQLIPAVYGDCKGREIFKETIPLKGKNFSVSLPAGLKAKSHYMVLDFSDMKERKFTIDTIYNGGGNDKFNLRISKFSENLGKNFIEFDQANEKSVKSINGILKKDGKGSVTLSVCRYSSSE